MLFGSGRIKKELAAGTLFCEPAPETIQGTHIDVHLGRYTYWLSRYAEVPKKSVYINISTANPHDLYVRVEPKGDVLWLPPYTVCLCRTEEAIGSTVASIEPLLETRSTVARWGLPIHLSAGWGDPGYHGWWTLEIVNHHGCTMGIPFGARVGSVAFFDVDDNDTVYPDEGRYQHTAQAFEPEMLLPRIGNV